MITLSNIIIEICKKELKTRLGSKATIIPLIFTFILPVIVFLPKIYLLFSAQKSEPNYFSFIMFLIIPVMMTNIIGIHSFINEIRWKTFKTLLVAPIDIEEILIGKSLACILVGIIADLLLSLILLITGININLSILLLFFCLGPLVVIYATFLLVLGTLKFPKIAELGGGLYFSISGHVIAFLAIFLINIVFSGFQLLIDFLSIIMVSIFSLITYFSSKKMFNKEYLALSW